MLDCMEFLAVSSFLQQVSNVQQAPNGAAPWSLERVVEYSTDKWSTLGEYFISWPYFI